MLLIVVTTLLLIAAVVVEKTCSLPTWGLLLVYLVPYLLIGHDTLKEAAEGLAHGDAFDEHFLMSVATLGALAIGFLPGAENQFPEAVFVMLFFQVGELFEGYAEGKSRDSIAHLMDIRPDAAHVERHGEVQTVVPDQVQPGETIVIKPGERVPLDGVVLEGHTALNTVALTGESAPRDVAEGDEVISGCVNLSGLIKVRTTKCYGESTVAKIIHLVEDAGQHKSKSEAFITRFARIYTPIVVGAAVLLALVPPLCSGHFAAAFPTWLYRALMFLVVSCPCALVISVPLTFFGGIGGASRRGILVKGANYIDVLSRLHTVVFDKTGTLTHGQFAVEAVHPDLCDERQLLHLAAHVEHFTTHPIGAALRDAFPEEATDGCSVTGVEEVAGQGIKARVEGRMVCVGNTKMMDAVGARWHDCHCVGTIIHVAINGSYAGHIVINDQVKADSAEAVEGLHTLGVEHTVMLTGDREAVGAEPPGLDALEVLRHGGDVDGLQPVGRDETPGDAGGVGRVGDEGGLAAAFNRLARGALGDDDAPVAHHGGAAGADDVAVRVDDGGGLRGGIVHIVAGDAVSGLAVEDDGGLREGADAHQAQHQQRNDKQRQSFFHFAFLQILDSRKDFAGKQTKAVGVTDQSRGSRAIRESPCSRSQRRASCQSGRTRATSAQKRGEWFISSRWQSSCTTT